MFIFKSFRLLLLLFFSLTLTLGWGMAKAFNYQPNYQTSNTATEIAQNTQNTTTNTSTDKGSIGQTKYLEKCAGCHLPMPAEVLPTETWKQIIEKNEKHYGTSLPDMDRLSTTLIWSYLSTFSRPLLPNEALPYLVEDSRYFKALHPQVSLPEATTSQTCLVCHPNGAQLDYLTVSSP
jgi:hypothetical protein